jgi:hypothetical protein
MSKLPVSASTWKGTESRTNLDAEGGTGEGGGGRYARMASMRSFLSVHCAVVNRARHVQAGIPKEEYNLVSVFDGEGLESVEFCG